MSPQQILETYGPRESMEYDVVVVGAGPAGLAAAIRLKQLAAAAGTEVSVVVLEKGSEPGAHILSGAVMDPRAMNELFPNWKELGAPLNQPVSGDDVLFLKPESAARVPDALVPDCLHNQGNYVISLSDVCKWLAQQAEALGVEIFPGFAAAEVLYTDTGAVRGVATGNMGIGKDGEPHDGFQLGMELLGKYTLFAEGARGHLGKQLIAKFHLDAGRDPQSYAHRHQGAVGDRPGQGQARPGGAHRRLADGQPDLWRRLPVPPGRQQGHARPGGRPGLQQPLAQPLRGDAALEDAPAASVRTWKAASASATARAPSVPAAS